MAEGKAQVNTWEGLNVRAGAGTEYSRLGGLCNGTVVTYYSDSNGWLQINYNGQTGYICKEYTNITKELSGGSETSSGGTTTGPASSSAGTSGSVRVIADVLNVRMGPSTSYGTIGSLLEGKVVSYSEEQSGWLKIQYGTQEGWISKDWTEPVSSTTSTVTEPPSVSSPGGTVSSGGEATTMYCTTDSLNVRNGPGMGYGIVGQFNEGNEISVLGTESNGWKKISFNGGIAYVSGEYVSDTKPSAGGSSVAASGTGAEVVAYAKQFLGRTTKDLLGELTELNDLSSVPGTNDGYDRNCANFVSAILEHFNLIGSHQNNEDYLVSACLNFGYHEVDKWQAKPGDVWVGGGHAELVYSNDGSLVTLIGSNNGSYESVVQTVTLDTWSVNNKGGRFYSIQ